MNQKRQREASKKYTAAELIEMIRVKFSGNAFAVLEQVAAGTGAMANSWIDAVVFSLWPSHGIWRAACEVKVSRSDFLKELCDPTKNQWAREHFDFFWYVVAPGVAKDDEIPTGCGLMTVHGDGLKIVKHAPRREDVKTDAWIVASFARSLEKERERFRRDGLREAIESDSRFKESIAWQEGCERFVRSCGSYCHAKNADDVFEILNEIARSKSPQSVAADHAMEVLESFQDRVLHFLLDVAPLAANVLTARDETAKFLVDAYQSRDMKAVDSLRAALKKRPGKYGGDDRSSVKRDMETRELIQAEQS